MSSTTGFSIGFVAGVLLVIVATLVVDAKRKKVPPPPPVPPDVVYALDSAALRAYGEQVREAAGDSLRALFRQQARRDRARPTPGPLASRDTGRTVDTLREVCVPEVDLRTVMLSDTACHVRVDSLVRQDTINKFHIRLQQQEIKAERRKSKLLAGALVLLLTVGTVLNFAN